jgi:ribosome-interacting GTPase 1
MPINQLPEWYLQKGKYERAETLVEKIKELERLISMTRKHKGVEKQMKQLTSKLAKLRDEKTRQKKIKKSSKKTLSAPKQGFQVVIIGFTNSGKSTFLKKLTNADPKIASYKFTTKKPEIGMIDYDSALLQLVEIPGLERKNQAELLSIVRSADGIILLYNNIVERKQVENIIDDNSIHKPTMKFKFGKYPTKKEIFDFFKLIRVFTKQPRKKAEFNNPLILTQGATIMKAAKEIHKDFAKDLKFARVWGSAKYKGQRVDKEFKLKDGDIIEFHI